MGYPLPADDGRRVGRLREYRILDTEPEKRFDDLTFLASYICEAPVAMISLIDTHQWIKSIAGIDLKEIPREVSFCAHTIAQQGLLIVEDASRDDRFRDNPFVTDESVHLRFYAGTPLFSTDGLALGALCVLDRQPRRLTPRQYEALQALGRQVQDQMELRRNLIELRESTEQRDRLLHDLAFSERYLREIIETSRDGILVEDKEVAVYINTAYARLFGYDRPEEVMGKPIRELAAPEDVDRLIDYGRKRARGEPAPTQYEFRIKRRDGSLLDLEASISDFRFDDRHYIITFARDITERKRSEAERERLIDELRRALGSIKTLRGLLPICSSCKKIRDDKGYWNQLEAYVEAHSEADFTHGICPECARRLYPEIEP